MGCRSRSRDGGRRVRQGRHHTECINGQGNEVWEERYLSCDFGGGTAVATTLYPFCRWSGDDRLSATCDISTTTNRASCSYRSMLPLTLEPSGAWRGRDRWPIMPRDTKSQREEMSQAIPRVVNRMVPPFSSRSCRRLISPYGRFQLSYSGKLHWCLWTDQPMTRL